MAYVNDGDVYCDRCAIGEFVGPDDDHQADYPVHCASGDTCQDAIDLTAPVFGVGDFDPIGAETRIIGAIIGDLTDDGREYTEALMQAPFPTDYQRALHRLWSLTYGI